MGKRIMVAFDDSENAIRAAEYVAKAFRPHNTVILFGVVPDTAAMCEMNSPELTPYFKAEQKSFCTLEDQKKALLKDAMNRAKGLFLDAGFDEGNIALKIGTQKAGIARDLVAEAQSENCDLIVMGKRGISGVKDFFMGSVSHKVLNLAKEISVLLVN